MRNESIEVAENQYTSRSENKEKNNHDIVNTHIPLKFMKIAYNLPFENSLIFRFIPT